MTFNELKIGGGRIEPRPHEQRLRKHQPGDDQRHLSNHTLVVLIVSHEEQRQRSKDRQGDEGGEDRKVRQLITTEDTEDTEALGSDR